MEREQGNMLAMQDHDYSHNRTEQSYTDGTLLECQRKNRERQCRFRKSMVTCKSKEELLQYNEKNAEKQRRCVQAKWQRIEKENICIAKQTLDEFNESSVKCENVGSMTYQCSECGALCLKVNKVKVCLKAQHYFLSAAPVVR